MPSPSRMVARGIVRHCPRCGSGHLFRGWFRLRERCPGCGMKFEREEGFWLGGYVINFGTGEASILVLLAILIGILANGGKVNVPVFAGAGIALAVIGPIVTFPYSRTIWSAIDLIMRPLADEEIVAARSAIARQAIIEADHLHRTEPPGRAAAPGPGPH